MKKDNVEYLPMWKVNATAEERFSELAMEARKDPKRFSKVVVVYVEELPLEKGETFHSTLTRHATSGCSCTEALGMLSQGQHHLLQWMYGDD